MKKREAKYEIVRVFSMLFILSIHKIQCYIIYWLQFF